MKVAETKTSSSQPRHQVERQPFFQKKEDRQDSFFSAEKAPAQPFFSPSTIQPKLKIGQRGDKYEREADAMADKVVRQHASGGAKQAAVSGGSTSTVNGAAVQSKCAEFEQEEKEQISPKEESIQRKPIFESEAEPGVQMKAMPAAAPVQRQEQVALKEEEQTIQEEPLQMKPIFDSAAEPPEDEAVQKKADDEAVPAASPGLESRLSSSRGGGSALPEETRSEMEGAFGADFSGVRVHTDSSAVQMNRELGAQAFTHGSDVYFGAGKYDAGSSEGKGLLAHELTHTVQQGGAKNSPSVQKKTPDNNTSPSMPSTPLDISQRFLPTPEWKAYLEKNTINAEVKVKIGNTYEGTIKVNQKERPTEAAPGKYRLAQSKIWYLDINGMSFFQPMRNAEIIPILVLKNFEDDQMTRGFLSVKIKNKPVGDVLGLIKGFNNSMKEMGFLGLDKFQVPEPAIENKFEQGKLTFMVKQLSTKIDGFLTASGGFGIIGDSLSFNITSRVEVKGVASGDFSVSRGEDGLLHGKATLQASIANIQAEIIAEYLNGAVTIQGTGQINSEKFRGTVTLLVTNKEKSTQMMYAALGVQTLEDEKAESKSPKADKPVTKTPQNQVLVCWGTVQATITPWLEGTAKIGVNADGQVTIIGEIVMPNEVILMEQRGKKIQLVDFEIRAGYGVPLVGQVFIFGGIGLFINAGFGPLVLRNVKFTGTYSTDPAVTQNFSITGVLNINAFAILGLEAEAGVGVTLLGHDVKAGLNVTAAAGLKAYAEAQPTFEYIEKKGEQGGKVGEAWLKGHFEAAAQLFLQLGGSFFVELDSPWWSPAPDDRWDWPLGQVEYPIGDSMGIGADVEWLVGSPEAPELKFSPVEFNPEKFTSDVMADPPPGKGGGDKDQAGTWEDGTKKGDMAEQPEMKEGDKGLEGKKKIDYTKLPDEERFMKGLDEISKIADTSKQKALTKKVVESKLQQIKQKYALNQVRIEEAKDGSVTVFVKHAKQDNSNNMVEIPVMSEAERIQLLSAAMEALDAEMAKRVDEKGAMKKGDAEAVASSIAGEHPVIEGIQVVDGGKSWDFNVDTGDKQERVLGKAKAEVDEHKELANGADVFTKENNDANFTVEGTSETHTIYVDEINGVPTLIIESTPTPLLQFITSYENLYKSQLTPARLEWLQKAKDYITAEIHPLVIRIEGAENQNIPKQEIDKLLSQLLEKNMFLGFYLRQGMKKGNDISTIKERYALEGLVGQYSAIPEIAGDNLEADHQPQNSLFTWIAFELPYFSTGKGGFQMRARAKDRSDIAYAINLHHDRHKEGRTYGGKATGVLNSFKAKVNNSTASLNDDQAKRNVVIEILRDELSADANAMRAIYNLPVTNAVWADIKTLNLPQDDEKNLVNQIKQQVNRGEDQLERQPLDNLKE